jgi:hypothetical protein
MLVKPGAVISPGPALSFTGIKHSPLFKVAQSPFTPAQPAGMFRRMHAAGFPAHSPGLIPTAINMLSVLTGVFNIDLLRAAFGKAAVGHLIIGGAVAEAFAVQIGVARRSMFATNARQF